MHICTGKIECHVCKYVIQTLTVMQQFQITIFNKEYNDHNYKIMELIKLANTVKMQKKKGGVVKSSFGYHLPSSSL